MRPTPAALAVLLALAPAAASARGPSTAAERRRAVEVTRQLERDPLESGAGARRAWLMKWVAEIPDIEVRSCSGPLDVLAEDDDDQRHGRLLYLQSIFGMAAFLAEHPARKGDWIAVQTAGLESVLRAYRAILAVEPGARWPQLDRLAEVGRRGELAHLVEETMAGCEAEGEGLEETI